MKSPSGAPPVVSLQSSYDRIVAQKVVPLARALMLVCAVLFLLRAVVYSGPTRLYQLTIIVAVFLLAWAAVKAAPKLPHRSSHLVFFVLGVAVAGSQALSFLNASTPTYAGFIQLGTLGMGLIMLHLGPALFTASLMLAIWVAVEVYAFGSVDADTLTLALITLLVVGFSVLLRRRSIRSSLDLVARIKDHGQQTQEALESLEEGRRGLAERIEERQQQLTQAMSSLEQSHRQRDGLLRRVERQRRWESLAQIGTKVGQRLLFGLVDLESQTRSLTARAQLDPEDRTSLEQVLSSGTQAKSLAHKLLAFGQQLELDGRPMTPEELLKSCWAPLLEGLPSEIAVDSPGSPDLEPVLKIDPEKFKEALAELIQNAVDAMPFGGSLSLRLEAREGGLQLHLTDSGVGIPIEQRDQLFEPFYTTKTLGSGMGLPAALGLIELHGGRLRLESRTGRGTCASIWLPPVETELEVRSDG